MSLIKISESEREREREAENRASGDHLLRRFFFEMKKEQKEKKRNGDNGLVVRRKPIFPSSRRQRPYAPRRPFRKRKFHLPAACGTTFLSSVAVPFSTLSLSPSSYCLFPSFSLSLSSPDLPCLPSFSFLPRANYAGPIAVRVCYRRSFRLP